ncbi:TlpA family protein disulfide reductase [Oligoflexaceae bacterium]|nr:TlpA family protein disulfide reductase [Oligoflexaceae bacterium]
MDRLLIWFVLYCTALPLLTHSEAIAQVDDSKGRFSISDNYVHEWLSFPTISAESIYGDQMISLKPREGRSILLIFISSWCIPCQNLMPDFLEVSKRHQSIYSDIVYVFANDTSKDAIGFAKEYKLDFPAVLANDKTMKTFNHPESPSIFIGDRHGWMTYRSNATTLEDVKKANQILNNLARG